MAEQSKQAKEVVLKKVKFLVGSIVYLKTDPGQYARIVVVVNLTPNGYTYLIRHSTEDHTEHFDIEMTDTRGEPVSEEEGTG